MKKYYWALVKKDKPNELVTISFGKVSIFYTNRATARKVRCNNEKVVKVTWDIVNEK